MRHTLWLVATCLLATACGGTATVRRAPTTTDTPATTRTSPSATVTPTTSSPKPSAVPTTRTTTTTRTPAAKPQPNPEPPPKRTTSTLRTSLSGDTNDAFAFAPLGNPNDVTVEGSVPSYKAWSTSKVLVVAAFLDTVCGGDPARASAEQKRWIARALSESHMESVLALRDAIPGSPGAAITDVLRSIGDTRTVAPDTSQGGMQWTIREQVRFMAALSAGRVVSGATSAHIMGAMRPIGAHRWGLGTIGAGPFKGGWLRSDTVTRQMGIVDGYAVAIITYAVGPAVVQTDGDAAHVQQMNYLAKVLDRRLAKEAGRG